jgi:acetyltransferase-like isoleucine patch superfamily enzyme
MNNNSFYSTEELKQLGFKKFGNNVLISRHASFYSPGDITIGDNVRIDDFCILSGDIKIGSFIHISAYSALYARNGIEIDDFSGLSPRVTIFSATDDFSGDFLIGPMVPSKYTNVTGGGIIINKFVQIGCDCVLMPGIRINEGVSVGAMSFVNKNLDEWGIYAGIPVKYLKPRSQNIIDLSKKMLKKI